MYANQPQNPYMQNPQMNNPPMGYQNPQMNYNPQMPYPNQNTQPTIITIQKGPTGGQSNSR
jgi:hypothetical protein